MERLIVFLLCLSVKNQRGELEIQYYNIKFFGWGYEYINLIVRD